MIATIAAMYFGIALTDAGANSAAAIEMRCGAQFAEPAQIVQCLDSALQDTQRDLNATEDRLFAHLRQIRKQYPQLNPLDVDALLLAWQQSSTSWRKFSDDSCAYYTQLHGAIGEGELERAACFLRAAKKRFDDIAADEVFWREKFPLTD